MNKVSNIARNTSYLTVALIIQKVLTFTYFALLARYLGPENLGKYYFAISFTTIFSVIVDLGLGNVLTREAAKDNSNSPSLLGNILSLKIPLLFISILAVAIIINVLPYDGVTRQLVYISLISMVFDSFSGIFFSVVRAYHNLFFESISSICFQVIVMVLGLIGIGLGAEVRLVMLPLAVASICNFFYSFWVVRHKIRVPIKLFWNRPLIRQLIVITAPFAIYAIFQRVYTYLDSVLLSLLAGDRQVGLYQVAFKIIFALQFLPMAFTASLYPAMSFYWLNNREQLKISFERAINYLTIISLPIIFGIFLLADKVVLVFKADYIEAIWPLKISIIALFFIFLNFPIGSLLNACDRQARNTWNMVWATILSVIMNVILIPHYQALGASITALVSSFFIFILGMYWSSKLINYSFKKNLKILLKALGASLAMVLVILPLKNSLNFFLVSAIGALAYFLILFLFKGIRREDVFSIIRSFRKKNTVASEENSELVK
ncbi:MAG: flippase [Planctomycetes bacterium]|jgi:O-antigen/teichoic acid export membrane protein|nr:flippase [Planctomycetota bacterium]